MNGIFLPMLIQGLAGLNRRLYDGGRSYTAFAGFETSFAIQAWSAVLLGAAQIPFLVNLLRSQRAPAGAAVNPWGAGTREWTSPRATQHPIVPHAWSARFDTGVSNITLGTWLLLTALLMLLGGVFSAYAMLRVSSTVWPVAGERLHAGFGVGLLLGVFVAAGLGWRASGRACRSRRLLVGASGAIGAMTLATTAAEWRMLHEAAIVPATSVFFALYFVITGLLGVLALGGASACAWLALTAAPLSDEHVRERARALTRYWTLVAAAAAASLVTQYLT